MKSWKAELLLVLNTVIWGATFTFTKIGIDNCSVYIFMFVRFLIAITITLLIWGRFLVSINKQTLRNGLMLGSLFAIGFILQTVGLKYTSVTKSAFLTGMAVVFTPFTFKLIIKKKIKITQLIGVIIAAIGLYLLTNPSIDGVNTGDLLTFISAIFWALYITYMDVFTRKIREFSETIQLVFLQFIVAAPFALLGHVFFDMANFKFILNENLITAFLYNGILASVLLTTIHTAVQKFSNPVKAALIFSLEPVFATIIAVIILSETVAQIEITGAAIIILGVIFSETGDNFIKFLPMKKQQY